MKQGNERFRTGKTSAHDYLAQKRGHRLRPVSRRGDPQLHRLARARRDHPRLEIGDTFNARVAGNIANEDLLGSLEFACAVAGAKVVLVMGHTACGAIKGAIDNAQLGNLTGLLDKIKPAVAATSYEGDRTSKNDAFVDAVAKTNVRQTVDAIRQRSDVLADLEKEGKIKIVGSMYHLVGGRVEFL